MITKDDVKKSYWRGKRIDEATRDDLYEIIAYYENRVREGETNVLLVDRRKVL